MSDTIGPFPPPPSPRPGDLGAPAEGYTRGVALTPPAEGTVIAVTTPTLLTSYFLVRSIGAKRPDRWMVEASRHSSERRNFEIRSDGAWRVVIVGVNTGQEMFAGAATHATVASLDLTRNLPEPGCIFYDLEGE